MTPPAADPVSVHSADRSRRIVARLLLPGALWGLLLFVAFAFFLKPRPARLSQFVALILLAALTACLHGGMLTLLAAGARRLGRWADLVLAALAGVLYGLLGMSLVKYSVTRSHLRFEDLWFLATSARQAAGEGTSRERLWLTGALVLPALVATGVAWLLARARRAGEVSVAGGGRLALLGATGILALATLWPTARFAVVRLIPDSNILVRHLERALEPEVPWSPDPAYNARLAPRPAGAPTHRWNVVVLMLESVSFDRLFGPAARPESTPHLRALAAQSVLFRRAWAVSTHSDYAQTSILASLFPKKSDQHDYFYWISYPRALPWDVLAPFGWRSAVFSTQNEKWGNMIGFLDSPRLELLRHAPDFPGAPRRGEGSETKIFEEAAVDAFLDWVREEPGRPFVAYLNFQATHYPYVWPDSFTPPYGPAPIDFPATFLDYPEDKVPVMLDRFHNALAYVDQNVGAVVAGLRDAERWEETALLVVADHGEAFFEHSIPTHGTSLLDEQLRVPMLLRLPGVAPRVVHEPVSTLDAIPSLYAALGLPRAPELQGSAELLDPGYDGARRPLFFTIQGMTREDGLLLDGWKRIVNYDRREGALYDLLNDPGETANLVLHQPQRVAELDLRLDDFLARQTGYYRERGWRAGWGPPSLAEPVARTPPPAAAAGTP